MKTFLLLSLLGFSTVSVAANKVTLFVTFTPSGSFEAVSDKLKGNLIKTGKEFTADKLWVPIDSFTTGIKLRDQHFKKHLKSHRALITDLKGSGGKAQAMLELNNIKKPIAITYEEKKRLVTARFEVKASDYQLPPAGYLGIRVADKIAVEVETSFFVKVDPKN